MAAKSASLRNLSKAFFGRVATFVRWIIILSLARRQLAAGVQREVKNEPHN